MFFIIVTGNTFHMDQCIVQ